MADFLAFDQGADQLVEAGKGMPTTSTFDLSTKKVGTEAGGEHKAADTEGGGFGLLTGTGYTAKTQSTPAPSGTGEGNRQLAFSQMIWKTESATDWLEAKSVVLRDATTKKLICAWNLQTGGAGRNLGAANVEEKVTPTLKL